MAVLQDLADERVGYDEVEDLTGVALKTLQNQKVPNVGTRQCGQFRLGALPFRVGAASPARLIAAFDELAQHARRGIRRSSNSATLERAARSGSSGRLAPSGGTPKAPATVVARGQARERGQPDRRRRPRESTNKRDQVGRGRDGSDLDRSWL